MGGAIAQRLAATGFDLAVWDRTTAKAQALNVGRVALTPAEAVRGADIAISSLTNAAAVRDVYLGPQGAFGTSETPYSLNANRKNGEVWVSNYTSDRLTRFNPKTKEMTHYLMPEYYDSRQVVLDQRTGKVVIWLGSINTAHLIRIEPLD